MRPVPVFQDLPETEELPTAPSYATRSRATAPAACALIETPAGPLLVYGTIIAHFGDRGPLGQSKYNTEQQAAILAHAHDWRRLHAQYPGVPLIVAGDFNATCDHRNQPTVTTCTMLRAAIRDAGLACVIAHLTIDHICVSTESADSVTVEAPWQQSYDPGRGTGRKPVSDHHGVSIHLHLLPRIAQR